MTLNPIGNAEMPIVILLLYLSGLNMMVPILNKKQKAMVGPKTKKPS